jgi:small-conductance mechanosensitive channel
MPTTLLNHPLVDLLQALLLFGAFVLVLRLLRKRSMLVQRMPVALTSAGALFAAAIMAQETISRVIHPGASLALWAGLLYMSIYIGLRISDIVLFEIIIPKRRHVPIPVVLRDICRWTLSLAALFLSIRLFFPGVNFNAFAISSIVLGYILGNASQETLGNLISGLALNTENTFSIGDWVSVGGQTGKVIDMTWRTTCLRTKQNDYITIPNAVISADAITNYSRPTSVHGYKLTVGVAYTSAPNQVREVLRAALSSVPDVLQTPAPKIWLTGYGDFAITYTLKFFSSDFAQLEDLQSDIMDAIWYHFKRAGITIPFPIRDVNVRHLSDDTDAAAASAQLAERLALLAQIPLFAPLSEEDRRELASGMSDQIYGRGEQLVRQGDSGTTFFIIADGTVRISLRDGTRTVVLNTLERGDFFGEMSLLTGERRSASVVAESDAAVFTLTHEHFGKLLARHEELVEALAEILATREAARQHEQAQRLPNAATAAVPPSGGSEILGRIRGFFGLPRPDHRKETGI